MEIFFREQAERRPTHIRTKKTTRNWSPIAWRRIPCGSRAAEVAISAWRGWGAGMPENRPAVGCGGIPNFIEVNPLAGLNPDHSDLPILCNMVGIRFHELIASIMASALKTNKS